ncbi:protein RKD5-like isoform X2 [Tasmannia lanceolata]|uniref:protein RKD5-like isoform X2 n=1 Tax=Tasmannia lanceolata TaxID=3420 RepID=UPI004063F592
MDSSKPPLLTALAVFKNILNEELIRSIHVYRLEDGKEKIVEREFMFSPSSYVEMVAHPLIKFPKYRELFEGKMIGLWLCMLAFDIEVSTISAPIPSILTISRQRLLEREKEGIETIPFMEIQGETKRFRQDVFRRRHRAKALNNNDNIH